MLSTWNRLAKQNTGSHICDSGSHYGYNYNRPSNKKAVTVSVNIERCDISASISTQHYCDAIFNKDKKMHDKFVRWAKKQDGCWLDSITQFCEDVLNVKCITWYTYNFENDLDRDIQVSECVYEGETYYFVQFHNGCDARGGLSSPIVCTSENTYCDDYVVGWTIANGTKDGVELDCEATEELCEQWQIGYTSYPTGRMLDDVESIISVDGDNVTAVLKTGETVTMYPSAYWE